MRTLNFLGLQDWKPRRWRRLGRTGLGKKREVQFDRVEFEMLTIRWEICWVDIWIWVWSPGDRNSAFTYAQFGTLQNETLINMCPFGEAKTLSWRQRSVLAIDLPHFLLIFAEVLIQGIWWLIIESVALFILPGWSNSAQARFLAFWMMQQSIWPPSTFWWVYQMWTPHLRGYK